MPTCPELIVCWRCLALSPDPRYCCADTIPPVVATPREHSGEQGMIGTAVDSARMESSACYPERPTQAWPWPSH